MKLRFMPVVDKALITFILSDLLSDPKDGVAFGKEISKNKKLSKLLLRGVRPQEAFKDLSKPIFKNLVEQAAPHPEIIVIAYSAHSRLPGKDQISPGKSLGPKKIEKYFKDHGVAAGLWKCFFDPGVSDAGLSRGIELAKHHLSDSSALNVINKIQAKNPSPSKNKNTEISVGVKNKVIPGLEKELSKLKEKYDASLSENKNLKAVLSKKQADRKTQEKRNQEREKIIAEMQSQRAKIEDDLDKALTRDKNNTKLHLKKEEKLSNLVIALRKKADEDKDLAGRLKTQTDSAISINKKLSAEIHKLNQTVNNISQELEISKKETLTANSKNAPEAKPITFPADLSEIRIAGLSAIRSEAKLSEPNIDLIAKMAIFVKSVDELLALDGFTDQKNIGKAAAGDTNPTLPTESSEEQDPMQKEEPLDLTLTSHDPAITNDINAEWDVGLAQLKSTRKFELINKLENELFGDETPELIVVDGHNVAFKLPVSGEKKSRKKLISLLDILAEQRGIKVLVYFDTKYSFPNSENGGAQVRYCPKRAGGADPEILTELNVKRSGPVVFVSDDEHIRGPVSVARSEGHLVYISGTLDFIDYLDALVN